MISLPYGDGAQISEHELATFIQKSAPDRKYIILGASKVAFAKHSKKRSLDYWLRQRSRYPNTMQAVPSVIDALIATGLFEVEDKLLCDVSHRYCKGLRLK